jgi:hypothetical protein
MEFIELKSVGSLVTNLGDVHPTSDIDNKIASQGVNIFECTDEWYWNLSLVDGYNLFSFLEEHLGYDVDNPSAIHYSYTEWKEKVRNLMGQPDTLVEVV